MRVAAISDLHGFNGIQDNIKAVGAIMDYNERSSLRSRHMSMQISLPLTLIEVVDRFASANDLPASKAVAILLRQGLKRQAESRVDMQADS